MKGLTSSTLDPHSVGPEAIQITAARCATETVTFLRENIQVCFHGMLSTILKPEAGSAVAWSNSNKVLQNYHKLPVRLAQNPTLAVSQG